MSSFIYLDNSTQTKPSVNVIDAMMPFLTAHFGHPLSPHQKGQELLPPIKIFIKNLYTCLGADEEDSLVLTSSGTEAINHVFSSVYRDITLSSGKSEFLTAKTCEIAALKTAASYDMLGCVRQGIEVSEKGLIEPKKLIEAISPRTALVSISWACGLTGVIQPVAELAKICRDRGIRFHIDATHVMGKLFFDLQDIKPDYLSLDGSTLHAPNGSGLLLIKQGIKGSPFIYGSSDQGGMRGGSLNIASLAALATAHQESCQYREVINTETARLRNKFEETLCDKIKGAQVCFKSCRRVPSCTALLFPGIYNEALLFALNRKNVFASIGGGNFQPLSTILQASAMDPTLSHTAISFSLSRDTTEEEIDQAISIIIETVNQLGTLK